MLREREIGVASYGEEIRERIMEARVGSVGLSGRLCSYANQTVRQAPFTGKGLVRLERCVTPC